MLEELIFVVIVLAVGSLMVADVARTRNEGMYGHAEGHAFDAKRPVAAASPGSRESFSRAQAGTAMPAAARDVSPARHPAGAGPSAGADPRPHAGAVAGSRTSRRRLRDWHVRTRLLLLVIIPLAAAAAVGLCVSYIIGARANSSEPVLLTLAVGALIIVVALASWFTIAVARSLSQPLQRLRTGALELTGGRLADAVRSASQNASQNNGGIHGAPFDLKPIDVDASDEIGEIARAFDEMRREFLRLAVGEATYHGKLNATFVELSHRGQTLMDRQIRLLQHLEQGEPDAQRLAILLRVKSIGNRMHRHSENLLILVGHEPSNSWNQPVTLAHVIRAAISELEEYQRVAIGAQPDVAIVGSAVNDVVHLLIELTENATSFSAADMQVDVSSRALTSGGVLLQITDRGVGMTPKEMAYANWQLENPPTADAAVPKWIGLLVVARLAARHGIRVRLQSAEFGGLAALVWLPDDVLMEQGAMATRFGGFAGAGSRRGLHEAVPDHGYSAPSTPATAPREVTPAGGHAGASSDPDGVLVPPAGDLEEEQKLPVYNAVESHWFGEGRGAPGSPGHAPADRGRWSSPADAGWRAASVADSPTSAGSTTAGLPQRMPNANLVPGSIPSAEPVMPNRSPAAARERLATLQRGIDKGRAATGQAATGQAASPGQDEETQPGSPE